ncbi:unnamed protein product [Blepharisma stoltei]|uniref:Uncharacterized protein n=1 Tax=Blepharisma stoltei TaxID=1481888 RepID=A0AAU9IV05_9CILI|nr:unnamed protein product [Blepharisma stoltei]
MDPKTLGDQHSQSPEKSAPFTNLYADFYSLENPFSIFKTSGGANPNLSPQLQSKTQNSSPNLRMAGLQKSAPNSLRKVIPPPPGFEWAQDTEFSDKSSQSDQKCDSPTLKLIQHEDSYQSMEELVNELKICKSKLSRAEKEVEKYKSSYYTLLQLQDSSNESRVDKLFQYFKVDENLSECKTCKETHEENLALHERIAKFSIENNKVLTSFHDLFTQFQAVQNENRELLEKFRMAMEGKQVTFNCTVDRCCSLAKEYRDQLFMKQRETEELRAVLNTNGNKHASRSNSTEEGDPEKETRQWQRKDRSNSNKQVTILECQECLNKQLRIAEKDSIIKELQESLSPSPIHSRSLDSYASNKNFQVLKERFRQKLSFIRNLLGEPRQIVLPGQKALISLIEKRESLERWWSKRAELSQESEWIKEGQQLISQTCVFAKEALELKPTIKGRPGREMRMSVHKQVIEIEQALNDLTSLTSEVQEIKRMFLELPYLLKPMFDLMKEYEQQSSGIELSPDLKLESVISELKLLQESLGDQQSQMENNEQFAPVRRTSKRHRTNAS